VELEQYKFEASKEFLEYTFYSEGPRGNIKKMIRSTLEVMLGLRYYNLSFGDWNDELKIIDDLAKSNNQDIEKIFATIATAVLDFCTHYPDAIIYAIGSTPARTRRYQMELNKYLKEIETDFELFGFIEDKGFISFRPGINYLSFLAFRKIR
jgi:hypothetical protein